MSSTRSTCTRRVHGLRVHVCEDATPACPAAVWLRGRKMGYSSRLAAPPKQSSYWDSASWNMPAPPSFLPDKWYVRVAWVCVLALLTVYANLQLAAGTGPPA